MARVPEEDPSTNSIGGGRRLLNASTSLAGRNERASSWVDVEIFGEKDAGRRSGDASIIVAGGRWNARTKRRVRSGAEQSWVGSMLGVWKSHQHINFVHIVQSYYIY